jgi:hypothetical protein
VELALWNPEPPLPKGGSFGRSSRRFRTPRTLRVISQKNEECPGIPSGLFFIKRPGSKIQIQHLSVPWLLDLWVHSYASFASQIKMGMV